MSHDHRTDHLLYLSYDDVERVALPMQDIIRIVEEVFLEKGHGRVEMPPKPGIHPMPDAFIHAMPAYIPASGAAGVKWVSGFPANYSRGLPYITGLLILNDPETGIPLSIMDCTWVTAKRTGAATAVAAKHLARMDADSLAILGCGVQGRSHVEALTAIFPDMREVRAYDVLPESQTRFVRDMTQQFGIQVTGVVSPQDAVRGADITVTAGPILKHPTPLIEADWLKPGCFVCPIDFDSYVTPGAFHAADKLYTDDVDQQRYYTRIGYFQETPEPQGDLGEVVAGLKPGRESDDERIIAVNLGIALEDMAVAINIYRQAVKQDIGRWLRM